MMSDLKNALKITSADLNSYELMPVLIRQQVLRYMFSTGESMANAILSVESIAAEVYNKAFAKD